MKRERGMASWIKIFVPWENIYPSFLYFRLNGNENKWRRGSVAKNAKTLRLRFYKNPKFPAYVCSRFGTRFVETLSKRRENPWNVCTGTNIRWDDIHPCKIHDSICQPYRSIFRPCCHDKLIISELLEFIQVYDIDNKSKILSIFHISRNV